MRYIFAYGSLMQGFWNYNRYLYQKVKFIGKGSLEGELYHLPEGYPGFIDGEGVVRGEVMELLDPSTISTLDILEGYSPGSKCNLYNRKLIKVRASNGEEVPCWVYCYNNNAYAKGQGELIIDGDWRTYIERERRM